MKVVFFEYNKKTNASVFYKQIILTNKIFLL